MKNNTAEIFKNNTAENFKATMNELEAKGFSREFGGHFDYVEDDERYTLEKEIKYRLDEKNSFEIIAIIDANDAYEWHLIGKILYIEKDGEIIKKEYKNKGLRTESFLEYSIALEEIFIEITEELRKAFL